jgi:hypothetical protein
MATGQGNKKKGQEAWMKVIQTLYIKPNKPIIYGLSVGKVKFVFLFILVVRRPRKTRENRQMGWKCGEKRSR